MCDGPKTKREKRRRKKFKELYGRMMLKKNFNFIPVYLFIAYNNSK